jgi:vacuolar-type H+-ATPase subunit H
MVVGTNYSGHFFSGISFIWLAIRLGPRKGNLASIESDVMDKVPDQTADHIFNQEFIDELRNKARLHFEKIITDNSMFLQQDLRLTTSQLNEFMKSEILSKLKEEFAKYEQSIDDAKQLAVDSIKKTNDAVEQQRQEMNDQVKAEISAEKDRIINIFEQNMNQIISHYVMSAIGDQIDLNDQLAYIISDLEANKEAIIKDLRYDG